MPTENTPSGSTPESTSQLFQPAEAESPAPPPATETVSPPRNPDGTFAPRVPAYLQRQAKDLGLSAAEVAEMLPEELKDFVSEAKLEKRFQEQMGRYTSQLEAAQRVVSGARPPESAAEPAAGAAPGIDWGKGEDGAPFTEQSWNPRIAQLIRESDELKRRLAALEEKAGGLDEIKSFHQQEQKRRTEGFTRRAERFFAKHPEIYGPGTLDQLEKDSPEVYARLAAIASWRKAGAEADALESELERHTAARYGRRPARAAEPADDEVERWEAAQLSRPTQRGLTPEPPSREKAIQGVREKAKTLNGAALSKTTLDEFLG